jgi:MtN3 and saliva related transmembrane protein
MIFTVVSYVAAFLTTVSFLPQAIKTVKTRDTSSISLWMYSLFTVGVICWMIYGIATLQWSIIVSNAITAVFAVIILGFKIAGLRAGK